MPVRKVDSKRGKRDDLKEQIVHEFRIISEGLVSQIKQVAEGVANVDEKLDRTRQELKAEIEEKTQPIAQAIVSLNGKVGSIEGRVDALDGKVGKLDGKVDALDGRVGKLDGKVDALDGKVSKLDGKVDALDGKVSKLDEEVNTLDRKLDGFHRELKTEIQETKQEILAAVKFSYAELDRRLTTLEKEFVDLKSRVDKMEGRGLS